MVFNNWVFRLGVIYSNYIYSDAVCLMFSLQLVGQQNQFSLFGVGNHFNRRAVPSAGFSLHFHHDQLLAVASQNVDLAEFSLKVGRQNLELLRSQQVRR